MQFPIDMGLLIQGMLSTGSEEIYRSNNRTFDEVASVFCLYDTAYQRLESTRLLAC